jgi:hypothetical protein
MALIAAGVLLAIFVGNVALGAVAGDPPLGTVAELLLLVGAAVAFTAAILKHEARAGTRPEPLPSQAEPGGTDPRP